MTQGIDKRWEHVVMSAWMERDADDLFAARLRLATRARVYEAQTALEAQQVREGW